MRLIRTFGRSSKSAASLIAKLEQRSSVNTAKVEPLVRKIIAGVVRGGDAALRRYAVKLDGLGRGAPLLVSSAEMQKSWESTAPELRRAMETAQQNIRMFAESQRPAEWTISPVPGVKTGQIIRPLDAAGCYVPGGRYPLPSTLLMTVIPAQTAGVERIVVCSPKPARETLAAAWLCGVKEFYRVGGAQAIAALAYGTKAIERVNKIVGPGNSYVTAAKQMVMKDCGIDMPAGPTEIGVLSETGDATWIASDLVAQAEHDPEALAVFITTSYGLAENVLKEVTKQARENALAKLSLRSNGYIFVAQSVKEARELINRLALEHLTVDAAEDVKWIRNAGSVFVGPYTPQSMGDYISGPNHVLPTGMNGRVRGGLSVMDYLKVITVQNYSRRGLANLGPQAVTLAEAEGLKGHAQSVRVRMR